ncbi:hypothetical protein MPH_00664 [Macrophomina phaseolina MS6]|uniref:Transmembrane protein n=1 Tax=Macrophomina phaseolina (strain MS6) TaxID=1126212 RepID=K2S5D0_MACPH|nr:hypothetical protein MPH_00664 [Macrophomina phaseolina MS6]
MRYLNNLRISIYFHRRYSWRSPAVSPSPVAPRIFRWVCAFNAHPDHLSHATTHHTSESQKKKKRKRKRKSSSGLRVLRGEGFSCALPSKAARDFGPLLYASQHPTLHTSSFPSLFFCILFLYLFSFLFSHRLFRLPSLYARV